MSAPIYTGGRPFFKGGIRTKQALIPSAGVASVTLNRSQSNQVFLFDQATAGVSYTLPTPVSGLTYVFYSTVLQTSGTQKVITGNAAVFLTGAVQMYSGEKITPSSTLGPFQFNSPLASSFVTFTMNGTTQGGGIGTWVEFVATSTTAWLVFGTVVSPSGNLATPFTV